MFVLRIKRHSCVYFRGYGDTTSHCIDKMNGIPEALDETCAYLVEPNSPKMLAAQVHKILSQPEEALCRAKRACRKAC